MSTLYYVITLNKDSIVFNIMYKYIYEYYIMYLHVHRQDSTIYLPNSELKRLRWPIAVPENMAALRERKVAWLVSHCKVSNKVIDEEYE